MIFRFEALNAKQGDCLLLRFGTAKKPRLIVIDGGPSGVFSSALGPRLQQLRAEQNLAAGKPFQADLLMISHIDDDHICGILDWFDAMNAAPGTWTIAQCWFNSFADVIDRAPKLKAATLGAGDDHKRMRSVLQSQSALQVAASVKQGRDLRSDLERAKIRVNDGRKIVFAPDSAPKFAKYGITLTLLAPNKAAVDRLEHTWEITPARALTLDNAVENLSSLVVMAECGGKRVLLTGDARGDYIVEGLRNAGYLRDGSCHVDVLKLPHHGSSRNCTRDLFGMVPADHYVISANGMFDNPDVETLCLLAEVRGQQAAYTVHLTNVPDKNAKTAYGKSLFENVQKAIAQFPWLAARMVYGSKASPIAIDLLV